MKKIISFLLCVAMLCSLVVVAANADPAPALSLADATATVGSVVELDMNVVNNPGLASVCFFITDNDGLHPTYDATSSGALPGLTKNTDATSPIDGNHYDALYLFTGDSDSFATTFGTLSITIPADAEPGAYTFTVVEIQGSNAAGADVDVADTEFTINVVDKLITGVNVSIDAGISIGVHVISGDIDNTSITAVDVGGNEYVTATDYEEGEDGDYIFYLNVNPWAMDVDFVIDFTDRFKFDKEEALDMKNLPATAKTTGILSYCNTLLDGEPSDELRQLIADLLEFGRQAQIYKDYVDVMELPADLEATVIDWSEEECEDFGEYCAATYEDSKIVEYSSGSSTVKKNQATARTKFKFDTAEIRFSSKFVVIFSLVNNGLETDFGEAHVKVGSEELEIGSEDLDLEANQFAYAFGPAECDGVKFELYASGTANGNHAWDNTYGYCNYASYVYNAEEANSADILALLEAFYNYGGSLGAYIDSLGE